MLFSLWPLGLFLIVISAVLVFAMSALLSTFTAAIFHRRIRPILDGTGGMFGSLVVITFWTLRAKVDDGAANGSPLAFPQTTFHLVRVFSELLAGMVLGIGLARILDDVRCRISNKIWGT